MTLAGFQEIQKSLKNGSFAKLLQQMFLFPIVLLKCSIRLFLGLISYIPTSVTVQNYFGM